MGMIAHAKYMLNIGLSIVLQFKTIKNTKEKKEFERICKNALSNDIESVIINLR